MKFGIELECWSPVNVSNTQTFLEQKGIPVGRGKWEVRHDGSLYDGPTNFFGVEIVSPILNTDCPDDVRMIRRICDIIQNKGFRVDRHCGFHVHVDAEGMSPNDVKRVFARYTNYEAQIDTFMPSNRRGGVYFAKSGKDALSSVQSVDTISALGRVLTDRYYNVNLHALQRHGTIEFRQHSATINANTIIRWVTFLEQFVKASMTSGEQSAPVRRRGRQPSATGIASGPMKVWQVVKEMTDCGRHSFYLSEIAQRSGFSENTVKAYISVLKTKHGIIIKKYDRVRCLDPRFYLSSLSAQSPIARQRTVIATEVRDTLWRGIDSDIKAFYLERAMELNGFATNVNVGA